MLPSLQRTKRPPRSPIRFLISERPRPSLLSSSPGSNCFSFVPVSITCTMTMPSSSRPRIVTVPSLRPTMPCLIAFETISLSTSARMVTAREGITMGQGSTSNVMCFAGGRRLALATPTIFRAISSTFASLTSSCASRSWVAASPCTRLTLSARV